MGKAFLSALGVMGRRHLLGLARAGCVVSAADPNPEAFDLARKELSAVGLPPDMVQPVALPTGKYDVAVFSETANARFENFRQFLNSAKADRILLEKPLSADPAECRAYLRMAREHGIEGICRVNFIRRAWAHVQQLRELCSLSNSFAVTINGGAVGLGCMGIHYLDTFLCLAAEDMPSVRWVALSAEMVASGRGTEFEDFGGTFLLEGARSRLLASLEAGSSANVVMVVRGDHFIAQIDYASKQWKLSQRMAESSLPNYRYGGDYRVIEEGALALPAMDTVTEDWVRGKIELPDLERSLATHHLLDEILRTGGASPPYRFT